MTALVDTSAYYALVDARDPRHAAARAWLEDRDPGMGLITHQYVVVETIALVGRRFGLGAVRRFVDDLLPIADVVWVDPSIHAEALEALLASASRSVSLVDRVSFFVMRRRGIETAFAFDDDFAREGFRTAPD